MWSLLSMTNFFRARGLCTRLLQSRNASGCTLRNYSNLSYMHKLGKEPLQVMTIGNVFEHAAAKYGNKIAVVSVYDQRKVTFEELFKKSNKLAAGFLSLGLQNGDRIGLWAPNIIEWVVTMAAAAQAGLILVVLNPISHNQDELQYYINKVKIKAFVCLDEYNKYKFYENLHSLLPELEICEPGKLRSQNAPTLKSVITISQKSLRGTYNYEDVLNCVDEETVRKMVKFNSSDAISNIQFTSGTTGHPKATCNGHFQQTNNAYQIGKRLMLSPDDRICCQVPLFHVFGTVVGILAAQHFGSTLVFPEPMYSSSANLKAIDEERCTVVYGTPTMFIDLINLQSKEKRLLNVNSAVIGGASSSPQLFLDMKNTLGFKKINSVYGLTETTAVSFQSLPADEDVSKVTSSVGCIGDHLEAKVVDANNNVVPIGVAGELCLRGYSIMFGYWDDEEKTNEIIGRDRWLRTGDQFILESDGYGKVVGRLKDMIIRGGENIFPKEIEDVLNAHPDILESYVIGLPHARLGEEVCACLRMKTDVKFNYDNILSFCAKKLSSYKLPTQFQILDGFPKTPNGKIQKHLLKEQIKKILV